MYSAVRVIASVALLSGSALLGLRASLGQDKFDALFPGSAQSLSGVVGAGEKLEKEQGMRAAADDYDAANIKVSLRALGEDGANRVGEEDADDFDDVSLSVRMLNAINNGTANPIVGNASNPAGRVQGSFNLNLVANTGTTAATLANDAQFVGAVSSALQNSINGSHSVNIDAISRLLYHYLKFKL